MAELMLWHPDQGELEERFVVNVPTSGNRLSRVLRRIFKPEIVAVTVPAELAAEAAAAVCPEIVDGELTPEAYDAQRELMRAANELPLAS